MNVIIGLLRICLQTIESDPDWMIDADAKVGSSDHQPGYLLSSLMRKDVTKIPIKPITDSKSAKYWVLIFIFLTANNPPIAICQNLQNGK
jgi:hypothetical protein